jgi:hypothetical protein
MIGEYLYEKIKTINNEELKSLFLFRKDGIFIYLKKKIKNKDLENTYGCELNKISKTSEQILKESFNENFKLSNGNGKILFIIKKIKR